MKASEIVRYWKYATIVCFTLPVFGVCMLLTGFIPVTVGRIATIAVLIVVACIFRRQYLKRFQSLSEKEQQEVSPSSIKKA